jgi:hypothetical protein
MRKKNLSGTLFQNDSRKATHIQKYRAEQPVHRPKTFQNPKGGRDACHPIFAEKTRSKYGVYNFVQAL